MGILDGFKQKVDESPKDGFFLEVVSDIFGEKIKGEVATKPIKFPEELGEEHPFDFSIAEGLYRNFGMASGVVNKYIDFLISGGFFVKSEDERAQEIIEQFMRDVNFDTILRSWIKEALVKGSGFLELGGNKEGGIEGIHVRDAKFMFVVMDKQGNVTGYNQFKGLFDKFDRKGVISFEPFEIAHIALNKIGDSPYGDGVIRPAIDTIGRMLQNEKSLSTLMKRKAGAPIHVKMGDARTGKIPSKDKLASMKAKLVNLEDRNDFVTDPYVEFKVVDYGNITEKFDFVFKHFEDMLFFTFQVPEVLMGRGNIPEGLANVQLDAFERRIQSIQAEVEKVIETQIFRRVLQANGLDVHVEFEWGRPSNTEKNERIKVITELLKIMNISPTLVVMLEEELAMLMGFNVELLKSQEEERKEEEGREQPIVPGQNRDEKFRRLAEYMENLIDSNQPVRNSEDKDYSLTEWLGFNYMNYLDEIKSFITADEFDNLKAVTEFDFEVGKLNQKQITQLKKVLVKNFEKGNNLRDIADDIQNKTDIGPLFQSKNGKVLRDKNKNKIIRLGIGARSLNIARTETTRTAAEGSLNHYRKGGVKQVTFVASLGERTCPICEGLNGTIFEEIDASGVIPVHSMCRCTFIPVFE